MASDDRTPLHFGDLDAQSRSFGLDAGFGDPFRSLNLELENTARE